MKNNILLLLIVITISCTDSKKDTTTTDVKRSSGIEKADWLIGSWQSTSPEGTVTESWTAMNDSTYAGKTFFISGKDTLSSESISLEQRDTALYYIPTVSDQNAGMPVKFTLTSSTADQLVFENPSHDFPQKMNSKLLKTSLVLNGDT